MGPDEILQRFWTPFPISRASSSSPSWCSGRSEGIVIPRTFGQYGHYRAAAITEISQRPLHYAGHDACETCHSDVLDVKKAGKHAHVNCEACHGPQAKHADDPGSVTPAKIDTADAVRALPRGFRGPAQRLSPGRMPPITPAAFPARPATSRTRPAIDATTATKGRRKVNLNRRHFLILMPAAAVAWKSVLAGTPESRPTTTCPTTGGACSSTSPSALAAATACAPARPKTMSPTATSAPGWSATTSTTST